MLFAALALFALAALGGLVMAGLHLGRKSIPTALALAHGTAAAAGVLLLILSIVTGAASDTAKIALGVFLAAALGGLYLFSFQMQGKRLPTPMIFLHGSLAVIAFLLLISVAVSP